MEFLVCSACLKSPPQHFNAAVSSSHTSHEGETRAPSVFDRRGLSFLIGSSSRSRLEAPCWCFRGFGDYFLASCSLLNLLGQLYRSWLTVAWFFIKRLRLRSRNMRTCQIAVFLHRHLSGFFGGGGCDPSLYSPSPCRKKRVTIVCIKRMIYLWFCFPPDAKLSKKRILWFNAKRY